MLLSGAPDGVAGARSLLMLINASRTPVGFKLPAPAAAPSWQLDFDTDRGAQPRAGGEYHGGDSYRLAPRSFVLLLESA